jgi:hypothetical protein
MKIHLSRYNEFLQVPLLALYAHKRWTIQAINVKYGMVRHYKHVYNLYEIVLPVY